MNYFLILPLAISIIVVLSLMNWWIRKVKSIGLVWENMNKINGEKVSGSGGLIVLLAFLLSVLCYVAYRVFILESENGSLLEIFVILIMVTFMGFVGFIDDLFGWRKGGLSARSRILLAIFGAIPLVAIEAGDSTIGLPFFGSMDLGLLYPLIFIPLGVVATTTTFNMLAGFNGLEAGQGIILLSGLAFVSYMTGSPWLAVVCLCMVLALIGFFVYNKFPASVLPGDVMTYSVGAIIAAVAILGNFERIAMFFYIPYILEVILKSRGKLKKNSFGKPMKDGTLDNQYDKWYSLNHVSISTLKKIGIKSTEKNAVRLILSFQVFVILLGIFLSRNILF
ncbi:glycosyl transferase family 4 [Candidatus Pacearchaeota archaeon]|nr:glycosyl transferase family 4 [Candidatus Pacearchaeota archaeon]